MQDLACFCVFGFMIIYNKKKLSWMHAVSLTLNI
jgi:hypothetical protein